MDYTSRLAIEVEILGDGLIDGAVTLEEYRARVAELQTQGLPEPLVLEAEHLAEVVASSEALLSTISTEPRPSYYGLTMIPMPGEELARE